MIRTREPHKVATTTYANEIASSLNKFGLQLGEGPPFIRASPWVIGRTVATGPDGQGEPSGEAYWVQVDYVVADPKVALPADWADASTDDEDAIIGVTNRAERPAGVVAGQGTHLLPPGTPVMCWATEDTDGDTVWLMQVDPPGDFTASILTATQDGTNFRWVYTFAELEKTSAGYGGWTTKSDGRTGTLYNRIEDINGASGLMGNGVNTADLSGTSITTQPIPVGLPVLVNIVPLVGGGVEYWTSYENGETGGC